MYVTRCIIPVPNACQNEQIPQEVLKTHESMDHLLSWIRFNNMEFGNPEIYTNHFLVAHLDGSPLTKEELRIVCENANSGMTTMRDKMALEDTGYLPAPCQCQCAAFLSLLDAMKQR